MIYGTSQGVPFTKIPLRLFHILSFFLDPEELKSNKQTNNIKTTVNGAPRVYRGEYTEHEARPLVQLILSIQVRDLERMNITMILPASRLCWVLAKPINPFYKYQNKKFERQ